MSTNTLQIIKESPSFVMPKLATAIKSALGELNSSIKDEKKKLTALTKEEDEILCCAVEAQHKTAEAALSYFELCEVLHKYRPELKVARALLFAAGFPKSRVSELMTVAFCSDRLFNDYAKRAVGFRLALEQARDEKKPPLLIELHNEHAPVLEPVIAARLGDRKKVAFWVDDVKIVFSRKKPAENQPAAQPAAQPKKAKAKK